MSLWLLAHCSLHYSLPPSPCLLHTTASLHSKHISDFKLTMSDINPRHIIPWEAALGFKLCRGLSRDSPSLRAPEVEQLLDRIKKLGARHVVCRTADQLRRNVSTSKPASYSTRSAQRYGPTFSPHGRGASIDLIECSTTTWRTCIRSNCVTRILTIAQCKSLLGHVAFSSY
jgi:hypothetical protein